MRLEPQRGDFVRVRSRRWLVEDEPAIDGLKALRLACVDDDAQGAGGEPAGSSLRRPAHGAAAPRVRIDAPHLKPASGMPCPMSPKCSGPPTCVAGQCGLFG